MQFFFVHRVSDFANLDTRVWSPLKGAHKRNTKDVPKAMPENGRWRRFLVASVLSLQFPHLLLRRSEDLVTWKMEENVHDQHQQKSASLQFKLKPVNTGVMKPHCTHIL